MTAIRSLLAVAIVFVAASQAAPAQQAEHLHKFIQCFRDQEEEFWPCVKEGALGLMDHALTMDNISLVEGVVSLERDPRKVQFFDASDEMNMPYDLAAREDRLDSLLWRRAFSFMESSSLRIKLPTKEVFEGRLKMKKMKKLAVPLMIVMTMLLLAALAMKAVVISKVALAVVSWVFVKKFLNGGAKKETFEIIAKHPEHHEPHHHHHEASNHIASIANHEVPMGPYGRLFEAQALAYQAQKPSAPEQADPAKVKTA